MTKTITFNELRRVKDSLPSGSMTKIAEELGLEKKQYVIISEDITTKTVKVVEYISNRDLMVV